MYIEFSNKYGITIQRYLSSSPFMPIMYTSTERDTRVEVGFPFHRVSLGSGVGTAITTLYVNTENSFFFFKLFTSIFESLFSARFSGSNNDKKEKLGKGTKSIEVPVLILSFSSYSSWSSRLRVSAVCEG